ncbi:hypothetical protein Bbelb_109260 [Branchiostoma belcheri]|nr:hypothetical protein Bbelb_109260 [Branchiostoma belcheri]
MTILCRCTASALPTVGITVGSAAGIAGVLLLAIAVFLVKEKCNCVVKKQRRALELERFYQGGRVMKARDGADRSGGRGDSYTPLVITSPLRAHDVPDHNTGLSPPYQSVIRRKDERLENPRLTSGGLPLQGASREDVLTARPCKDGGAEAA